MSVKLELRNKGSFFRALNATVPAINKELRAALAQAGDEMAQKAQQLVPVDEGELRGTIEWDYTRKTKADNSLSPAIVVLAGGEKGQPGEHARHVEFGTHDTVKQPYFFPAYRLLRRKIRGRLTRSMTKAIKAAGFGKK